jgi:hypothetical protein
MKMDILNDSRVHKFVKDHVFTRLWVQFSNAQRSLPMEEKKKDRVILPAQDNPTIQ